MFQLLLVQKSLIKGLSDRVNELNQRVLERRQKHRIVKKQQVLMEYDPVDISPVSSSDTSGDVDGFDLDDCDGDGQIPGYADVAGALLPFDPEAMKSWYV